MGQDAGAAQAPASRQLGKGRTRLAARVVAAGEDVCSARRRLKHWAEKATMETCAIKSVNKEGQVVPEKWRVGGMMVEGSQGRNAEATCDVAGMSAKEGRDESVRRLTCWRGNGTSGALCCNAREANNKMAK